MSTYSISNIPGAEGQVSLSFTDLQSSKDLVYSLQKVTEGTGKNRKIESYHTLKKHVFNEVLQKNDRYISVYLNQVY